MSPRVKTDLHIHTVASGHAYSTIREVCAAAATRGIEMVGMTDHGPALPGAAHVFHFTNMVVLPRVLHGVKVLRSVECNIVDVDGSLDLHERALDLLDIVHAGLHPLTGYEGGTVEENTRALLSAIAGGMVDVLVHPGNPLYRLDYEAVARAAASNNVLIEVNASSDNIVRRGSRDNCLELVRQAKTHGAKLCVASDAHDASLVGVFDRALELMDEVGVDDSMIANLTADDVLAFLRSRGRKDIQFQ